MLRPGLLLSLSLTAAACASSTSTPAAPVAPAPTVTQLRLNTDGPMPLLVGESRNFSAVAVMSDGNLQSVPTSSTSWSTSDARVVQLTRPGYAVGMGAGDAVIRATYQGVFGEESILVVSNYNGRWQGNVQVNSCNTTDGISNIGLCRMWTGTIPMTWTITQPSSRAWGPVAINNQSLFTGYVSGGIDSPGNLRVGGELQGLVPPYSVRGTITDWTVWFNGAQLVGYWTVDFRTDGVTGKGTVTGQLVNLIRTQ